MSLTEISVYLQGVILLGFVLSRAATVAEAAWVNHRSTPLDELLAPIFHWYGALFGFSLVWAFVSWLPKGDFRDKMLNFFNALSVTACLILAIGKIGCFLDGHEGCGGIATDLPWGAKYSWGTARSSVASHPVQIYDSLVAILLGIVLYRAVPFKWVSVVFLLTWSVAQILMEYICPAPKVFICDLFNLAQVTYMGILVLALVGLTGIWLRDVRQSIPLL